MWAAGGLKRIERGLGILRRRQTMGLLGPGVALARLVRSILPFMYKSATVRRLILRDVAWHGDRLSADRALEMIDDGIGCAILADLCASDWQIARLDPLPCLITIAWGEKETLLPVEAHGKTERIPQARKLST